MSLDLPPPYDDLTFMSPLSDERAAGLVDLQAGHTPPTVLDLGCGWGELLLRVGRVPTARGVGVDQDEPALAQCGELATRQRAAYFAGYRGILGLAHLRLVAL